MKFSQTELDSLLQGNRFGHFEFLRRLDSERKLSCECRFVPERVYAGRYACVELRIGTGAEGLSQGGRIAVKPPPHFGGIRDKYNIYSYQNEDPFTDGYVAASNSSGNTLAIEVCGQGAGRNSRNLLLVTNTEDPLEAGEFISIHIGDPVRSRGICIQEYSGHELFRVAVDPSGEGDFYKVAAPPELEIVGNHATHFLVNVPATPEAGQPVHLSIAAVDDAHDNPDFSYYGELSITTAGEGGPYPKKTVTVNKESKGVVGFDDLMFPPSHVSRVVVEDKVNGIRGISNPVVPEFLSDYRIFFGDIHGHTRDCDGGGSLEDYLEWGRDVMNLDFCAVSNHSDQQHTQEAWSDMKWRRIRDAIKHYHAPGRFVTFFGYEWSNWNNGHRNVYFLDESGPIYTNEMKETATADRLWKKLEGENALSILHHPAFGCDMQYKSPPAIEPLVEIFSIWGCSETEKIDMSDKGRETATLHELYAAGMRLGVIAGTDNHLGRPAHGWTWNTARTIPNPNHADSSLRDRYSSPVFGNGLACILAKSNTRNDLIEAMRARRTYATTGERILLDFRVDNQPMGSEIVCKGRPNASIRAIGTRVIERLEIIRDGSVVYSEEPGQRELSVDVDLATAVDSTSYVYARITQVDGNLAWSSPVWFSAGD